MMHVTKAWGSGRVYANWRKHRNPRRKNGCDSAKLHRPFRIRRRDLLRQASSRHEALGLSTTFVQADGSATTERSLHLDIEA
jgi:hypothetical protein